MHAPKHSVTSPIFLFSRVCPSRDEASPGDHSIASPSFPLQSWHQRLMNSDFLFHKGLQAQAWKPVESGPTPGGREAKDSVAPSSPPLVYLQIPTLRVRKWLLPFTIHTGILQAVLRSRLIRRKMLFGRNKSWKTDPVKLTFNFLRFTTITTECTGVVTCRAKSPE